jgi:flagellar hook protein FlgE
MLRSLYTGISGLNAHQEMLDVTANNIANVNTVGFKSSSTIFEDTLSETLSASGVNSDQVGLGVRAAATDLNFTQGSPQATGVPSNMMIQGDGFFMVDKNGVQSYTRNGSFTLDQTGHLVTADGAQLEDPSGNVLDVSALNGGAYVSYNITADGVIHGVANDGSITNLGQVGMASFANPQGLQKAGDSTYIESPTSGAPDKGTPGTGARGTVTSGYVEMSNVDLSQELTNLIVAERGFQANSKVVTTSDEVLQTLVNLKN